MDRAQYDDYVACFNRGDFDGFSKYYDDDVVFELGDLRVLRGRDEIVAFYREVKERIRETFTPLQVVMDEEGVAVESETEFVALDDWPDFVSGPMRKGDVFRRRGLVMYTLRDGKFSRIRSARTKVIVSPWNT